YEDAVAAYGDQGCAPETAQSASLADLGDAQMVRRMLRRVHLSRGERIYGWLSWLVPQLWQHHAGIATTLFGLLALVVVVGDHRHWISYRGHIDPLAPISLIFVVASLILERELAVWSYPAVGYLLTGVWPWAFITLFPQPTGPFWNLVIPLLLPVGTLITLAFIGLQRLRRREKGHIPSIVWVLVALILVVPTAMSTVQPTDQGVVFNRSALTLPQLAIHTPLALYMSAMMLAPIAIGLLGARRDGIAAVLIPMACHYSTFVGLVDPTYHLTFYDYWQPSRTLHIAEALVTYLPALSTFLIAPLWMLRARSTGHKTAAVLVPTIFVLVSSQILSAIGLQYTGEAYTAATWVSSGLGVLEFFLPVVLAVILYRQFPATSEQCEEIDLATYPSGDHAAKRMSFSATS
ncbi:MAG: hypothetical protein J7M39_12305, partial [Anaerolineae bacterium]|nr:hypothetical protein [Anaerolineae bacterium]